VALGRANLDGSGVNQNLIGVALGVFGVAVDGQHVYSTDSAQGTIGRAKLDGSGVDDSFVVGADHPAAVAVDALPLAPLASITTPAPGATYTVGHAVDSTLACSGGAGGPGVTSCVDQSGRASGAAIDTSSLGSHTFTVTATSSDGQTATSSEAHTVAAPTAANPVLGDLRESHSRWRERTAPSQITSHTNSTPGRPAMGTNFAFTLNQAATVKLIFTQHAFGRVVTVKGHSECVAVTRHTQQMRKCARAVTPAGLSLKARSGADKISLRVASAQRTS
jgi:hypothetical protein